MNGFTFACEPVGPIPKVVIACAPLSAPSLYAVCGEFLAESFSSAFRPLAFKAARNSCFSVSVSGLNVKYSGLATV